MGLLDILFSGFFPEKEKDSDSTSSEEKSLERSYMTADEKRADEEGERSRRETPWIYKDDE